MVNAVVACKTVLDARSGRCSLMRTACPEDAADPSGDLVTTSPLERTGLLAKRAYVARFLKLPEVPEEMMVDPVVQQRLCFFATVLNPPDQSLWQQIWFRNSRGALTVRPVTNSRGWLVL